MLNKILNGKFAMLAKEYKDIDWNEGLFQQRKLDGVRAVITKDGIYSRNGLEFKNAIHVATALKPLFKDNPTLVLDGELFNECFNDNFNKIISLVRKSKPTQADKFKSSSLLQFHVYDCVDPNVPKRGYGDRWMELDMLLDKYSPRSVKLVETKVVWDEKEMRKFHEQFKAEGFEGSILRYNLPYEHKRSKTLIKVKDWNDTEFRITGYTRGRGKFQFGIGKFHGFDSDGLYVDVPAPNFTLEKRRLALETFEENYLNKQATFEFFERTPDNAYRFPRFKEIRNYE